MSPAARHASWRCRSCSTSPGAVSGTLRSDHNCQARRTLSTSATRVVGAVSVPAVALGPSTLSRTPVPFTSWCRDRSASSGRQRWRVPCPYRAGGADHFLEASQRAVVQPSEPRDRRAARQSRVRPEYALTKKGRALAGAIQAIAEWPERGSGVPGPPSAVKRSWCRDSEISLHNRATLSRVSSALFVQTKGRGSALFMSM